MLHTTIARLPAMYGASRSRQREELTEGINVPASPLSSPLKVHRSRASGSLFALHLLSM